MLTVVFMLFLGQWISITVLVVGDISCFSSASVATCHCSLPVNICCCSLAGVCRML